MIVKFTPKPLFKILGEAVLMAISIGIAYLIYKLIQNIEVAVVLGLALAFRSNIHIKWKE